MNRRLLPLSLALLAVAAGLLFFLSHERVSEEERVPPRAEALRNPFLAAQRLAEARGLAARRIEALHSGSDLPARALLIAPAPRGALSAAARQRVEAWVEAGGHLLIESELPPLGDPLLDLFGVERVDAEGDWPLFQWSRGGWDWEEPLTTPTEPGTEARVPSDALPPLRLRVEGPHALASEADILWRVGADELDAALQLRWGEGRVTVLNSLAPLRNWDIGRYDHAEFLVRLLEQTQAETLLVLGTWRGGLFAWLGTHAWRALLAGGLLIALLLWAAGPRFGPLAPDPEPVRRRLLDHLAASGRLLWSRGARAELARAATGAALRRLRAEFPHSALLEGEALALFLARRCAVELDAARRIVAQDCPTQPLPFLALVRACRRVHASLAAAPARAAADPLFDA